MSWLPTLAMWFGLATVFVGLVITLGWGHLDP